MPWSVTRRAPVFSTHLPRGPDYSISLWMRRVATDPPGPE